MKTLLVILASGFLSMVSQAQCLIPANQIEEVAKKIQWHTESGEQLNTSLVQVASDGVITNEKADNSTTFTYEAFLRPDQDGTFQLLPVPLFVLELKHSRNSVYVCAHYDSENEDQSVAVIYFLRYNLISTVIPKPLPIMGMKNILRDGLKRIPFGFFATLPFEVTEFIQGTTMQLISEFTRIGIDRIRITPRQIELYSGGNPAQFERYVVKKVIPFDKPQTEEAPTKSPQILNTHRYFEAP